MQIYFQSLQAIQQQTMQLDQEQCKHCKQTQQLVSHGFIRKKRLGGEPAVVGKRVFCSNRNNHTGCGRTVQLYRDATLRYLHYAAAVVAAFLFALLAGVTAQRAYHQATGTAVPRNAYRWLSKVTAQLSVYRSLSHQPQLLHSSPVTAKRPLRRCVLLATVDTLRQQYGVPLCAAYQRQWQRSFL